MVKISPQTAKLNNKDGKEKMKYTTFIFDFDYTLVDATIGIMDSFNYGFTQLGIKPKNHDSIKKTIGMPLREGFFELLGKRDKPLAEQFVSHFKTRADAVMTANTVLFDDTLDVLSQLKKRNCNIAIVTSKNHFRIDEVIEKYKLHELIDYVLGIEDVSIPKPSPEGLLKTIEHFRVSKQSALFTGDTIIDANTAANASMDFAAVTTGSTSAQEFEGLPHVCIAKSLTEMYERATLMI